ncbi:MAG: PQQ-binding-like beta-propeller repeat protein [Phycisphaerae bacterium]|nr:PQQ-binding-like beta-propeller repeat protein [Phycisphaerae bacterium]
MTPPLPPTPPLHPLALRAGALAAVCAASGGVSLGADPWPMLARSACRVAEAGALPAIAGAAWIASHDPAGSPVTFAGQAGVVSDGERVYAIGTVGGQARTLAYDAASGTPLWSTAIPTAVLESWAAPAVDLKRGVVLAAAGFALTAIDAVSGAVRWQTPLPRPVVNASPAITSDRDKADRALLTLFDGYGLDGRLVCVNVDPFDSLWNPYLPGQIVWSVVLGGSSGNSPAYADGVVYVSTITTPWGGDAGQVIARRIDDPPAAPNLWTFTNPEELGFFGGVSVDDSDVAVYAASYAFAGGLESANLVKLDAASGELLWSTPCNRTSSIPVPIKGGYVLLSGGLQGFGSAPSLALYKDRCTWAERVWDTALDTWQDLNQNQVIDPGEYLRVGGWTQVPAVAPRPDTDGTDGRTGPPFLAAIGAIPTGASTSAPCTDLYVVDLSRSPAQPGFVVGAFAAAGASPAVIGSPASPRLFTVGAAGLHAFAACSANCDASTTPPILNVNDYVCFLGLFAAWDPRANCDASTVPPVLNVNDFVCFSQRYAEGCP